MQTTCVSAPAATAAVQQRAARLRQSSFRPGMQCRGAAPAAAAAAAASRGARSLSVLAFRWDPRDLKASEKIQVSPGAPTRAKGCRRALSPLPLPAAAAAANPLLLALLCPPRRTGELDHEPSGSLGQYHTRTVRCTAAATAWLPCRAPWPGPCLPATLATAYAACPSVAYFFLHFLPPFSSPYTRRVQQMVQLAHDYLIEYLTNKRAELADQLFDEGVVHKDVVGTASA